MAHKDRQAGSNPTPEYTSAEEYSSSDEQTTREGELREKERDADKKAGEEAAKKLSEVGTASGQ